MKRVCFHPKREARRERALTRQTEEAKRPLDDPRRKKMRFPNAKA